LLDKYRPIISGAVPTIDITDDELAALTAAIRRAIEDDKFPHAPRLDPLRAALARLDAASKPTPHRRPRRRPKPTSGRGDNRRHLRGPGESYSDVGHRLPLFTVPVHVITSSMFAG
jgi:hypothetical protein